jgi:hypothetical protein
MVKWLVLSVICIACASCSATLETGYEPVKLGMSVAQRNALYADPYTQQAEEAQQDKAAEGETHRPGSY